MLVVSAFASYSHRIYIQGGKNKARATSCYFFFYFYTKSYIVSKGNFCLMAMKYFLSRDAQLYDANSKVYQGKIYAYVCVYIYTYICYSVASTSEED